jgi:hypothetical protein
VVRVRVRAEVREVHLLTTYLLLTYHSPTTDLLTCLLTDEDPSALKDPRKIDEAEFAEAQSVSFFEARPYGYTYDGCTYDGHTYDGHTYYGHTYDGHTYHGHTYHGYTYYGYTYRRASSLRGRTRSRSSCSAGDWSGSLPTRRRGGPRCAPGWRKAPMTRSNPTRDLPVYRP